MGTVVSSVSIGRDTVAGAGDGVATGPAQATPLMNTAAVTESVMLFQLM